MGNHFIKKYSKEDSEEQLKNKNLKWIDGTFINMSSKILLEDKEFNIIIPNCFYTKREENS